ncbi:LuxR C-terminal-related transcriptional regulator [Streptomyces sp. XM4193]|uniref:helix-turn-helix transcriptional regulator n=1 Tax=Streptomyces sp. XM4193 TaxID=2929782 RepID=UPI001FF84106|nr:LuxR C-terminal-related transcriptional regulator [Streptomyces sp. XM4193]MCK1795071.1 LuxR C-terminal-related transcriptional regulator [Streptomyces sp. XM4193]
MSESGIGLGKRSEHLYRTLLTRTSWRTHDLVHALDWPQEEVVRAMETLRTEGLASISEGDSTAFRAVEPCIALPALLARWMREGRSPQPRPVEIDRFIALHERAAERVAETPGEGRNRKDTSTVIERMVAKAERELIFLVPGHIEGGYEFSRPLVDTALRRGVRVRAIWASSVFQPPAAMAHAQWLAQQGLPPRTISTTPPRAMILDGSVAVAVDEVEGPRVLRSAQEVEPLLALTERLWERGAAIRQVGRKPGIPTPRRPRTEIVLRLLAEGLTDDAIARRLGCSVRTVRNDVASAMNALDARSRFQAGARAMQVGLI